jgi:hypothetical protein
MTILYVCTSGKLKWFGAWQSCCYMAHYQGKFATGKTHTEALLALFKKLV